MRTSPPKNGGALNEAIEVMNVSNAAASSDGVSCGSKTRLMHNLLRPLNCAQLQTRVDSAQTRACGYVEERIHRVSMKEQQGRPAAQPAGWFECEQILNAVGQDARFPDEKYESDFARAAAKPGGRAASAAKSRRPGKSKRSKRNAVELQRARRAGLCQRTKRDYSIASITIRCDKSSR